MSSDQVMGGDVLREAIASLSSPDRVGSPFGALEFFDGVPLPETVVKAYDALDLMRGIEVFLKRRPGGVAGGDASRSADGRGQLRAGDRIHRS